MKYTNNSLDMTADGSDGIVVADLRQWFSENDTELDLATALAQANMKAGWLMHDLNDPDIQVTQEMEIAFKEWWAFYLELVDKVKAILKGENDSGKSSHNVLEKRLHYLITPFMERNGYRDGSDWWIKE